MAERIWTQRDQALLHEAIGRELVQRLAREGRTLDDLTQSELANRRYSIHMDFHYGTSAGETRAKQANLFHMLDADGVPVLAQVVPFLTAPAVASAA